MTSKRRFLRALALFASIAATLFLVELMIELFRLQQPGAEPAKLDRWFDVLSPTARAYNNVLAMLLATIALAIPLTANLYTTKLIEMFTRDRINQFMLFFWALLAAHSVWLLYLVGHK